MNPAIPCERCMRHSVDTVHLPKDEPLSGPCRTEHCVRRRGPLRCWSALRQLQWSQYFSSCLGGRTRLTGVVRHYLRLPLQQAEGGKDHGASVQQQPQGYDAGHALRLRGRSPSEKVFQGRVGYGSHDHDPRPVPDIHRSGVAEHTRGSS